MKFYSSFEDFIKGLLLMVDLGYISPQGFINLTREYMRAVYKMNVPNLPIDKSIKQM